MNVGDIFTLGLPPPWQVAARARARGDRSTTTLATIVYRIAAPLGDLFKHCKST